jgi:hypothetical protein
MPAFGLHIDPPLCDIPALLAEHGRSVFQTTLRDPRRLSKEGVPGAEDQAAFLETAPQIPGLWGIAHASLLTSLGSPDPKIRNGSAGALVSDANLAASLGMAGVCFHVGYQKGHASREAALDAVAYKLNDVLARGYWFAPTILTNVRQDMPIMQEEIFGPVIPVMEFEDFDEGLQLANDSRYGLAAYLFTNDMNRILRAVRDLECGELYINRGPGESIHAYHAGWKQSGIGGDDGKYGLEHYLQKKTVYLRYTG